MPPPTLPPHLSHKVALLLLPPTAITTPIEAIRRKHDKHFHRRPPHINLIYPFLSNVSTAPHQSPNLDAEAEYAATTTATATPTANVHTNTSTDKPYVEYSKINLTGTIHLRMRRALVGSKPFKVRLSKQPRHFRHGKRSATACLEPVSLSVPSPSRVEHDSDTVSAVNELQCRLRKEFAECDTDDRPYTPHLSLGQAGGGESVGALEREAKEVIEEFLRGDGCGDGGGNEVVRYSVQWKVQQKVDEGINWTVLTGLLTVCS